MCSYQFAVCSQRNHFHQSAFLAIPRNPILQRLVRSGKNVKTFFAIGALETNNLEELRSGELPMCLPDVLNILSQLYVLLLNKKQSVSVLVKNGQLENMGLIVK